ncbi:MotB family protein [Methylobacterium sp. J-090]|uniref:MotB family protein n=1 Tax=Methylobacterium sp. J-090 TaxID=2836666 RepID=UPI001FBAE4FD|nr:MotB family protein [Methylobacterium sp. J-090]MCJ2083924.1 MotB family protein [Methylobacterium sp. J-090]
MADDHHEIIIIKRHGDHDEGHHGGAWKIALADFMTAMMALFLVLWLIGSTTKETKTAIAQYFNPVKLADVTFDRKGVRDSTNTPGEPTPEDGKPEEGRGEGSGKGDGKSDGKGADAAPGSRAREAALFQDPYAVLAKLAAEAEAESASADTVASETGEPGFKGGEAARDPFDPLYWQVAPVMKARTEQPGSAATVSPLPQEARLDARAATVPSKGTASTGAPKPVPVQLASALPEDGEIRLPAPALSNMTPKPAEAAVPKPGKESREANAAKATAEAAETAAVAALKAEIAKAMQTQGNAPAPRVEVRRTGEGILISLTDDVAFSMFGVGSAEPQAKVVRALEQVARILKDRPGQVVVRGHTDGRPFRSETYDNWRLSSARAQMASYMLVRGGLADARLERIEGYADRQPRNPADPKAAENRRIEILLRGRPE